MLVQWLLDHFSTKLHLEVTSDNEKAIGFYKKIGLVVIDEYRSKDGTGFIKFSSTA